MTRLKLLSYETGKVFEKDYESTFQCRKFLLKLQYSKRLRCIDITTDTAEELYEYRNIRIG